MEHDSSRSGYHQSLDNEAGFQFAEEAWEEEAIDDDADNFSSPCINLIWAQAHTPDGRPGAIGIDGGMPWHLAEDMKRFRELTISHPVIMGRRTWESLNSQRRPLAQRDNIVISSQVDYQAPGATVADSVDEALRIASQPAIPDDGIRRGEIWVIGGARIYQAMLPYAQNIYLTDVDAIVDADAFAPDVDGLLAQGVFECSWDGGWQKPEKDQGISRYRFRTLTRIDGDRDHDRDRDHDQAARADRLKGE